SLQSRAEETIREFVRAMDGNEFHKGLITIWDFIGTLNRYIDTNAPWVAAKDETRRDELASIIYNLVEGLRVVASLLYPVIPGTSLVMQQILKVQHPGDREFPYIKEILPWGLMEPGIKIETPPRLFPRVEIGDASKKQSMETLAQKEIREDPKKQSIGPLEEKSPANGEKKDIQPLKPEITIDHFAAIDLRAGTVLSAEKIKKSKKLLKLKVDLGEEAPRQIIAGIAGSYDPDELVGRQVAVVANLKPATLMGETSQGMVLAASHGKKLCLAGFDTLMLPGSQIK
ncbi:MAG: methionine--tRNA ligase subunit beta, partial [Desulfamplus sp.]|nr:methionine--tRNA ligase subunit beta [Desulfamplus sp.]